MSKQPTEGQRRWLGLFKRQSKGPSGPQDQVKERMNNLKTDLRKALKVRGYGEQVKQDFVAVETALHEHRYDDAQDLIGTLERHVQTALEQEESSSWVEDKSETEVKQGQDRGRRLTSLLNKAGAVRNNTLVTPLDLDTKEQDILNKIGTDDPGTDKALDDLEAEVNEAVALDTTGRRVAQEIDPIYARLQPVTNVHLHPPQAAQERDRLKAVATTGAPDELRGLDDEVEQFRRGVEQSRADQDRFTQRLNLAEKLSASYTPKSRKYKKLRDTARKALREKPRADIDKAIKALEVRLQRKVGKKATKAEQQEGGSQKTQAARTKKLAVGALVRTAGLASRHGVAVNPLRLQEIQRDIDAGRLEDAESKRRLLLRDIEAQMPPNEAKKEKLARRRRRVAAFVTKSYTKDNIGRNFTTTPAPNAVGAEDPAYAEYKTLLKAYDKKRSAENAVALAKAAQKYLAVHAALQEPGKTEQKPLADHCKATLASLGPIGPLAEMETLGERDDLEAEMRSGALYAKLLLEANGAKLKPVSKKGVNSSQWIRQTATKTGAKNRYIYKDVDGEAYIPGFPRGGSAVREVLAKRVNDNLQQQLGINFGVPETHLVGIDDDHLPNNKRHNDGTPVVGSMQHFARHKGEPPLKSIPNQNRRDFLKALPKAECHKMVLLDLVTLNTDRHSGNLMVQGDGDDTKLVPIDQGLTFPDKEGLKQRGDRIGPGHALYANPGCKEQFDPDTIAKIKQLDGDALVQEMTNSFNTMAQMHPGAANGQLVSQESFDNVKRSVEFLKAVCERLTVQQIMMAYSSKQDLIFTDDDSWRNNLDQIVDEVTKEDNSEAYWEFFYRRGENQPEDTSESTSGSTT
jgi:hypothetical protein